MMNMVMLVWCLAAAAAAEVEMAAVVTEGEQAVFVEYQREGRHPEQPQQPSNGVSQEKSGLVQQDIGDSISADRETTECFQEKVKEKFKEPTVDTKTSDSYGACKEKSLGMLESAKNVAKDVNDKLFSRIADAELLIKMAAGQVVQESENLAERAKFVGKKVVDNTKTIGGMVMEIASTEAKKLKGSTVVAVTNIVEKMGPSLSETEKEVARDLKEKAMNAYSYVQKKLHQTKEKDWNAITKIVEKMGPGVLEIAQGMAHDVKEKAMSTYSYVERKVDQAKEKDWNVRALAASRRIIDDTNNIGREMIGSVLDKAKQVKGGAFNGIAYRAKIIGSSVSETAQEMAHDVQVKTSNAYSHVEEMVLQAKKAWKVHGSFFCKKVVDSANDVGREAKEKPQQTKKITGTSDNLAGQMVHEKKVHEATCHGKDGADDDGREDLSHAVAPETFCFLMNVLHSLAFSVVSGTCFWVSFISSQVLSSTLSRQQFELVQSKIYPVYFRTMACGLAMCLATHLAICRWLSASQAHKLEAYNLLASLGFVLTNVCLGPQTDKVMHNILKLEREARKCHKSDMDQGEPTLSAVATNVTAVTAHDTSATKTAGNVPTSTTIVHMEQEVAKLRLLQMNRRLKNLNRFSSVLNVMSLMGLTWHQVHLSQQVRC